MPNSKINELLNESRRSNGKQLLTYEDAARMLPAISTQHTTSFELQACEQIAQCDCFSQPACNRHTLFSISAQDAVVPMDAPLIKHSSGQVGQEKYRLPSRLYDRFVALIARIRCFSCCQCPYSEKKGQEYHNEDQG